MTGWTPGVGWGWIWGEADEVGALNAMTDASRRDALALARTGAVYDLGVTVDRHSFLSPVHPHTEIVAFRTSEGTRRQHDIPMLDPATNHRNLAFMSSLVMVSDHAGSQIDGLAHITTGADDHWYNGFNPSTHGGDFGPRAAGAETIPPIIARGVLIDVAAARGVDGLPDRTAITAADLDAACTAQETSLRPGDVVLVRTGALSLWDDARADPSVLRGPDASGLTLEAARWLVGQHGAMVVGSDTSMVEVFPAVDGDTWHPVHEYLLVEQGVHMAELHRLEELSRDRVYEFCYLALVPKLRGTTAGFAMRPVAIA